MEKVLELWSEEGRGHAYRKRCMAIVYAGGSLNSIASLRTRWVGVTRETAI